MEGRIKELEDLTASLEKQVWALMDIVQLLAEDALEKDGEKIDKELLKSLLNSL